MVRVGHRFTRGLKRMLSDKMSKIHHPVLKRTSLIVALSCVTFSAAQAGFQWVPPAAPEQQPEQQPAQQQAAPPGGPAPVEQMTLGPPTPQNGSMIDRHSPASPVIKSKTLAPPAIMDPDSMKTQHGEELSGASHHQMGIQQQQAPAKDAGGSLSINPFPLGKTPTPKMQQASADPQQSPAMQAPAQSAHYEEPAHYKEVVGFGSDMPLALALRQVVPPQYSFSFGEGVNPGYRVSWEGGHPWNEVVNDMVAPLHLSMKVRGRTVFIIAGEGQREKPQAVEMQKQSMQKTNRPAETEAKKASPVDSSQSASQPRIWEAAQGDSLKATLEEWTGQANYDLVWDASHDYTLSSNVLINSTFDNAVKVLFAHAIDHKESPAHKLETEDGRLIIMDKDKDAG